MIYFAIAVAIGVAAIGLRFPWVLISPLLIAIWLRMLWVFKRDW